jgi:hypothetical protein
LACSRGMAGNGSSSEASADQRGTT